MNYNSVMRLCICGAAGVLFALAYGLRVTRLERARCGDYPRKRKAGSIVEPMLLVSFMGLCLYIGLWELSSGRSPQIIVSIFLTLLHISVYYGLLLFFLTLCRRTIKAETCASLWIQPGVIYCLIANIIYAEPVLVVSFPKRLIRAAVTVWLAGAGAVLSLQVISHFAYRIRLKRSIIEPAPTELSDRWESVCYKLGIKRRIPVYIADNITTPVTVGLFIGTMRLYLPRRSCTDEELGFIFNHEAQHIARDDTRSKFLLGFLAALSWFNPLSWLAMRKSAEDFELSCDEEVLYAAFPGERRAYAELLLKSADASWGYSTCLSSGARSLRYRLKNVVKPKKRLDGTFAMFIAATVLLFGLGTVGVADSDTVTVGELLSLPEEVHAAEIAIDTVESGSSRWQPVPDGEEAAIREYICSLEVGELICGEWDEYRQARCFSVVFTMGDDYYKYVDVYDDFISIRGNQFVLAEDADWDYLNSLIN